MDVRIRKYAYLATAAIVAAGLVHPDTSTQFRFRWAFGAQTGAPSARRFVPITDEISLTTGDTIKMLVASVSHCFIYVLHEEPEGRMEVLFPENGNLARNEPSVDAPVYIPAGSAWLELDSNTGVERIYLIAAARRLEQLERLLTLYSATPVASQAVLSAPIISELAHLRTTFAPQVSPERPITMGGQVRGLEPDLSRHAFEVNASGFYLRVFIVHHH